MNHYSQILNYFKEYGDSNTYVNTTLQGQSDSLFEEKRVIFPAFHVEIETGSFTNGVNFDVQLTILDDRDLSKELTEDIFWGNDNEVDNFNNTLAFFNELWFKLKNDFNNENIHVEENPQFTKVELNYSKLVEGWTLSFSVELPNRDVNICSL